jgi:hypothetical protein
MKIQEVKQIALVSFLVFCFSLVFCLSNTYANTYQFQISYDGSSLDSVQLSTDGENFDRTNVTDFQVTSLSSDITLADQAAYCVELGSTISAGTYYGQLLDITPSYEDAAKLVETYGRPYSAGADEIDIRLQSSIWETLEEGSTTYALDGGTFRAYQLDQGDISSNYLSGLSDSNLDSYKILHITKEDGTYLDKQDLIVKTSSVPIPGTVWLLGAGIIGLLGLRGKAQVEQ